VTRAVRFPDGTQVLAGAIGGARRTSPDLGLYAYGHAIRRASTSGRVINLLSRRALHGGSWTPSWEAWWLHWPDFGVPGDGREAAARIVAAFHRAKSGDVVEVRCYGGTGRTGTMLACMAVLAGVAPDEAIAWVRREYRPRAVERPSQERWVAWFAARAEEPDDPWRTARLASQATITPERRDP
jgi:protein-tyrosine phosphatase